MSAERKTSSATIGGAAVSASSRRRGTVSALERFMRRRPCVSARISTTFSRLGECALLHGVSYGRWERRPSKIIEMARATGVGFFPSWTEMTGELCAGRAVLAAGRRKRPDVPAPVRPGRREHPARQRRRIDVVREKTAYVPHAPPRRARRYPRRGTIKATGGRCCSSPSTRIRRQEWNGRRRFQAKIDAYDNILSDQETTSPAPTTSTGC